MEFDGPFQLPGRPSAVSWNPIPRIPQTRLLSPSLRGTGGVPAGISRDPNLLPFPAPIGLQPPLSASRPPLTTGQQESRTETPDLVAPKEELETITIVEDSSSEEEEQQQEMEEEDTGFKEAEEENSKTEQSRKRAREEDASEESPEDRTPTLRDLNKFGLFLLAMQWDKPGFDADEWIKKQKGTLAVLKVDKDE